MGALVVTRKQPGEFPSQVVDLLTTFASQSALAMQNARLFHQLEIASQHKSTFLANMSHELRTPLNAVIGFAEVLRAKMAGEVNEKQAEYLEDIREAGEHLLSLINDILDLSKIEAGRMELALSRVDLPRAIAQAMTQLRPRALREGIELAREVDPRLGEIEADERKLKQVLLNLLTNAVKFTPPGGCVKVVARRESDQISISINDNGVGIAPEDQARLFENFRQVGAARAEGTGLGLALSKRFVELHGGSVAVDSAPGKGSTFTVVLPAR